MSSAVRGRAGYFSSFLTTSPPFITKPTFSSSANVGRADLRHRDHVGVLAGLDRADSVRQPSRSAALTVAAWIACIGVMPHLTM